MINRPSRARRTPPVLFAGKLIFSALFATTLLDPARVCGSGVVTNCDEASLRTALASGGVVTFACEGPISLASTLIITNDTVLDATGHKVTLDGNGSVRIFYVANSASLTLINLTLANGRNTGKDGAPGLEGEPASGGGIFSDGGFVNLKDCTLSGNQAIGGTGGSTNLFTGVFGSGGSAWGGAIYSRLGGLSITNTIFVNNSTAGGPGGPGGSAFGGAIFSTNGTVNLVGLTFTNNLATAGNSGRACGGAFCVLDGSATVTKCGFSGNSAIGNSKGPLDLGTGNGGGIYHENGSLDVDETSFNSNSAVGGISPTRGGGVLNLSADGNGGGIFNKAGTVVLRNCLFYANQAKGGSPLFFVLIFQQGGTGNGGGVFNRGSLRVIASVFSTNLSAGGNEGGAANGGAIFSDASLIVSNSAFSGNLAQGGNVFSGVAGTGAGAAVYDKGSLTMVNSSFFDNSSAGGVAKVNLSGAAYGGGLSKEAGTAQIINCTFADNRALGGPSDSVGPGGLDPPSTLGQSLGDTIGVTNATLKLINTLVANSHSQSNVWGRIIDGGHNFCADASANFTNPTSRNNVDPQLAPFADNGGPTFTFALLPGSPAIDAGDDIVCPPTDQRGVARPIGAHCDIGAFEFVPTPSILRGPNGKVRLDFVWQPSRANTVEASTNLVDWLSLGMVTSTTNGLIEFKDQDATNFPARFYRVR